jgi:hypothetical protein
MIAERERQPQAQTTEKSEDFLSQIGGVPAYFIA